MKLAANKAIVKHLQATPLNLDAERAAERIRLLACRPRSQPAARPDGGPNADQREASAINLPVVTLAALFPLLLLPLSAAGDYRVVAPPEALRREFRLDPFYTQCVVTGGLPVVGSSKVSAIALREAAFLIDHMLAGRDDLRAALVRDQVRFGVLAVAEMTTDLPEYRDLRPAHYWNKRARGLGATPGQPLVSCGEENLLNCPGDPYEGENILVHEFAHAIHEVALKEVDPAFDGRLATAYAEALKQGLWKDTYAATNKQEYWAEGVQSWFDCNQGRNPQHNGIRTRERLKEYDPRLAALLTAVFRDNEWRYVLPARRKEPAHLVDLDRGKLPTFAWPAAVLEWNARNHGNGTIHGKAGASEIVIATTARTAGAIDSLRWHGKEFVDSYDHGRQIQSASSFDAGQPFVPETFNPTEAGSRQDGVGAKSSSNLHRFHADGLRLESLTQMAFWLAPGEKTPDGHPARNGRILSDHWLSKRVRIGYKDLPHAIEYEGVFTVPVGERHVYAQFEALTGYMPPEFSAFWKFDPATGELKPLDDGPGEQPFPVVLATAAGSHALGILAPDAPPKGFGPPGYGRFRFKEEKVNKWNCVYRLHDPKGIAPDTYAFRLFVAVGTREDVRRTLTSLAAEFRRKK